MNFMALLLASVFLIAINGILKSKAGVSLGALWQLAIYIVLFIISRKVLFKLRDGD